jgi:hypothetical protein
VSITWQAVSLVTLLSAIHDRWEQMMLPESNWCFFRAIDDCWERLMILADNW